LAIVSGFGAPQLRRKLKADLGAHPVNEKKIDSWQKCRLHGQSVDKWANVGRITLIT